jgi:DNA-binding CsgD family transcriptional regulator
VLEYTEREEALPAWEREMAVAHARGSVLGANAVHLWYGWSLLRRGDLRDAEALEREALVDTERYNSRDAPVNGFPLANLVDILLARGELHAAYALYGRAQHIVAERSNAGRFVRRARLQLMLALGRMDDAARAADAIAREDDWVGHAGDAPWRLHAAEAYAGVGRRDDALAVAEGDLERARHFGAPGGIGLALRTLGELRDDVDLLEAAVAVLDGSPRRLERARALTSLGTALRAADREAAARDVLVRACAEASICGAAGVLDAATAELRAAGGEPDPAAATGPGALTTLERRVAALASAGADVLEIAQAAFLTPHAVEVHLDGVRRKLGSASPDALMAALV